MRGLDFVLSDARYGDYATFTDRTFAEACQHGSRVCCERTSRLDYRPVGDVFLGSAPGWMKDALCSEPAYNSVNFFAQGRIQARPAVAICSRCLVRDECLADAMASEGIPTTFGVRGGLTASDRREIRQATLDAKPKNPNDRVYFAAKDGRIKIGHSTNLDLRMRSLHCELITTIEGGRELEQELHQRFAASRVEGEWFNPTPDLLSYIEWARERVAS